MAVNHIAHLCIKDFFIMLLKFRVTGVMNTFF